MYSVIVSRYRPREFSRGFFIVLTIFNSRGTIRLIQLKTGLKA